MHSCYYCESDDLFIAGNGTGYSVCCNGCGMEGPLAEDREEAAVMWETILLRLNKLFEEKLNG